MKNSFVKYALLAAMPLLFAQCQNISTDAPVPGVGEKETVDLVVRTSESGIETKTMLQDNSTVFWTSGDKVIINDREYSVEIDNENRGYAMVMGVDAADKYYAVYPLGYASEWNESMYAEIPRLQYYTKDSFCNKTSPMMAVGTGTDLTFHNMGSVLRLGLTGDNEKLSGIILRANTEGEYINGDIRISKEDFEAGNYAEISLENGNDKIEIYFSNPVTLTSEPVYVYVVVPPTVLQGGFQAIMVNDEGELCKVATEMTVTFERNRIKQMEDINCSFEGGNITLEVNETTPLDVVVSYALDSDMNEGMMTIIEKSSYDKLMDNYQNQPFYQYDEPSAKRQILYSASYAEHTWSISGEYENDWYGEAIYVKDNSLMKLGPIMADTEYVILYSYSAYDDYSYIRLPLGGISTATFKTAEATGTGPTFEISKVTTEYDWTAASFAISSNGSYHERYEAVLPLAEYDEMKAAGKSDFEIVLEAQKGNYWENETFYYGLFDNTEYIYVIVAVDNGGAQGVSTYEFKTDSYVESVIGADTEWTVVSDSAAFVTSTFIFNGEDLCVKGLKVEANADRTFYRIENMISVKHAPELADYGFSDAEGTYYTYIDARGEEKEYGIHVYANKLGLISQSGLMYYAGTAGSFENPEWSSNYGGYYDEYDDSIRFWDFCLLNSAGNRNRGEATLYLRGLENN